MFFATECNGDDLPDDGSILYKIPFYRVVNHGSPYWATESEDDGTRQLIPLPIEEEVFTIFYQMGASTARPVGHESSVSDRLMSTVICGVGV